MQASVILICSTLLLWPAAVQGAGLDVRVISPMQRVRLDRELPPGASMPVDHETVIDRYAREWTSFVKGRYSRFSSHQKLSLNKDGKLLGRMVALFRDPELPRQFRDLPARDVADFN